MHQAPPQTGEQEHSIFYVLYSLFTCTRAVKFCGMRDCAFLAMSVLSNYIATVGGSCCCIIKLHCRNVFSMCYPGCSVIWLCTPHNAEECCALTLIYVHCHSGGAPIVHYQITVFNVSSRNLQNLVAISQRYCQSLLTLKAGCKGNNGKKLATQSRD